MRNIHRNNMVNNKNMAFTVDVPYFTPYIINQRSKVAAVALAVFILASLLQLVALCTPGWAQTPDTRLGLFTYCGKLSFTVRTDNVYQCAAIPWEWEETQDELHSVRAMSMISSLFAFLATVMAAGHLWVVTRRETILTPVVTLCIAMSGMSVVMSIISCGLFGASTRHAMVTPDSNYTYQLSYSFALYVVGAACLVLAAVLVLVSVKSNTRSLLA